MMKPYWHCLSLKQQEAVFTHRDPDRPRLMGLPEGLTLFEFMEMFQQPKWCDYPDALAGMMGCWSLMNRGKKMIHSEDDCLKCECHKKAT